MVSSLNFRVFRDEGVNDNSYQDVKKVLKDRFPSAKVSKIKAVQVLEKGFLKSIHLLVIPGGQFSKMKNVLKEKGLNKIKKYAKKGGKLISICAAAYGFSCSSTFICEDPIERKDNPWAVFSGKAIGPIYRESNYLSSEGFKACQLIQGDSKGYSYYQGGAAFTELDSDTEVIARYCDFIPDPNHAHLKQLEDQPPAVIVTKNNVVMVGCHPESDLEGFLAVDMVANAAKKVFESKEFRSNIWNAIFQKLRL